MNIKDLIGTKSAVQCETEADWDKLSQLTGNERENHFIKISSSKCFDLHNLGSWWASSSLDEIKKSGYTIYKASEFIDTKTSNRFPFKLMMDDAKRIIHNACPQWQFDLSKEWASILIKGYVMVSESYYKKMRSACNKGNTKYSMIYLAKIMKLILVY